ncbi:MAG: hypothetical protein KGI69_03170 [Patescibacteria group bacterium]|nr:hypothetical protein [Patescibacteria group bacterium]
MASGVEFDEDKAAYGGVGRPGGIQMPSGGYSAGPAGAEPGMVRWLKAHGLAKSSRAAQGILIGVVIVNIIIMFVVIKFFLL